MPDDAEDTLGECVCVFTVWMLCGCAWSLHWASYM